MRSTGGDGAMFFAHFSALGRDLGAYTVRDRPCCGRCGTAGVVSQHFTSPNVDLELAEDWATCLACGYESPNSINVADEVTDRFSGDVTRYGRPLLKYRERARYGLEPARRAVRERAERHQAERERAKPPGRKPALQEEMYRAAKEQATVSLYWRAQESAAIEEHKIAAGEYWGVRPGREDYAFIGRGPFNNFEYQARLAQWSIERGWGWQLTVDRADSVYMPISEKDFHHR